MPRAACLAVANTELSWKFLSCISPLLIFITLRGLWLSRPQTDRLSWLHTREWIPSPGFLLPRRKFSSPTGLASKANQCLHGRTIWFAIRGNAPLWLLFKSLLLYWVAFPLCLRLFLKAMISLSSPSLPPPVPGSLPIQTSPNCPAPSFFSSLRDSRGISQASFSHGFCGLEDTQGTVSFWQSPSLPSGTEPLVSRGQPALSQPALSQPETSPRRPPCLVHCI